MIAWILAALLAWATLAVGWLAVLTVLGLLAGRRTRRLSPDQTADMAKLPRFAFVIPAHDEASGIARSVQAALAVDFPQSLFRVIVVADNCTDDTAREAAGTGAEVLVREDPAHRGKGYALNLAFEHLLSSRQAAEAPDAIVVMDADSLPSRNILRALAVGMGHGYRVIQVEYGILNPEATALTWLLHVGNVMENKLFHQPKSTLGLPTILRGNGMCFEADILRTHPWQSYSLAEDTEYSLYLLQHGIGVFYLPNASVKAESPTTIEQLRMQRLRWAAGNVALSRTAAFTLIGRGIASRDIATVDAGWSLLLTSRPLLFLAVLVPMLGGLATGSVGLFTWGAILMAVQGAMLASGIFLAGMDRRKLRWLFSMPFVFGWLAATAVIAAMGYRPGAWVRTKRR